jgi:type IV secretion system protein VirB5
MIRKLLSTLPILGLLVLLTPGTAHAQWAVIDVGAITQLVQEVTVLERQLTTAQQELQQAQSTYSAMTGDRGMENLLSGIDRNYLPSNWSELQQVLSGSSLSYGALASSVEGLVSGDAVLSGSQLASFSPVERANVIADREHAALLQAVTRDALSTTSQRFAELQQLIAAIPTATDEKAILDLQARIAVEQAMIQNEAIKLQVLYETTTAETQAESEEINEESVAESGSLQNLPPIGLE